MCSDPTALEARRRRLERARHAPEAEITDAIANAILGVLKKHDLTPQDGYYLDSLRYSLTSRHSASQGLRTSAFMGVKFWTEATGRGWRVDCYPEIRTPRLDAALVAANTDLLTLEAELLGLGDE